MRYKLAISVLVLASLFAATTVASAQTRTAPGTASEPRGGSDATKSNMKPGVTTGSATKARTTSKGVLPNSSIQDARDSGTGRGK
jgi:hypothetical protein